MKLIRPLVRPSRRSRRALVSQHDLQMERREERPLPLIMNSATLKRSAGPDSGIVPASMAEIGDVLLAEGVAELLTCIDKKSDAILCRAATTGVYYAIPGAVLVELFN